MWVVISSFLGEPSPKSLFDGTELQFEFRCLIDISSKVYSSVAFETVDTFGLEND